MAQMIFFCFRFKNRHNKYKMSNRYENTELTNINDLNLKNIRFYPAINCSIPNTDINYKRIPIGMLNPNGTEGDLIISTHKCFSYGVGETTDPINKKRITGYNFPLVLWSLDGPTDEEKKWVDVFNKIVDTCKTHIVKTREEIDEYELTMNDLKRFNPL